ncbi:MAG TPA: Clp protease N-terminal domain-containing protein, partial [Chloroflexota bacterium]
RFQHNYVGTEHLLLALVDEGEGLAGRVLRGAGVTVERVSDDIVAIVGRGKEPYPGRPSYTPRMHRLLKLSGEVARELGHEVVGTGDLLLGLLREGEGLAVGILEDLGVDLGELRAAALQELAQTERPVAES